MHASIVSHSSNIRARLCKVHFCGFACYTHVQPSRVERIYSVRVCVSLYYVAFAAVVVVCLDCSHPSISLASYLMLSSVAV